MFNKRINNTVAADRCEVSYGVWRTHLKFHVQRELVSAVAPDIGNIADTVVDSVQELVEQLDRTKQLVKRKHDDLENNDLKDPREIQAYVMLEKMLHLDIETLAKINGELNSSAVINVNNIKLEFNDFRTKIMEILCPTCKQQIIQLKE